MKEARRRLEECKESRRRSRRRRFVDTTLRTFQSQWTRRTMRVERGQYVDRFEVSWLHYFRMLRKLHEHEGEQPFRYEATSSIFRRRYEFDMSKYSHCIAAGPRWKRRVVIYGWWNRDSECWGKSGDCKNIVHFDAVSEELGDHDELKYARVEEKITTEDDFEQLTRACNFNIFLDDKQSPDTSLRVAEDEYNPHEYQISTDGGGEFKITIRGTFPATRNNLPGWIVTVEAILGGDQSTRRVFLKPFGNDMTFQEAQNVTGDESPGDAYLVRLNTQDGKTSRFFTKGSRTPLRYSTWDSFELDPIDRT